MSGGIGNGLLNLVPFFGPAISSLAGPSAGASLGDNPLPEFASFIGSGLGFGGSPIGGAGSDPAMLGGDVGSSVPLGSAAAGGVGGAGGASAAGAADPFGTTGSSFPTDLTPDISTGGTGAAPGIATGSAIPGDLGGFSSGDLAQGGANLAGSPSLLTPLTTPTGAGGADASSVSSAEGADPGTFAGINPSSTAGDSSSFDPSNVLSWLKRNKDWLLPAGTALNVGKQLISPSQTPGAADLTANNQLLRTIANNQASGNLNPAQGAAFGQQLASAQSAIRAKYASLGLSGSDAETKALNDAALNNTASQAGVITGNINQAVSAIGASNNGIGQLAQAQTQEDAALQQAIMALALSSAWGLSQPA